MHSCIFASCSDRWFLIAVVVCLLPIAGAALAAEASQQPLLQRGRARGGADYLLSPEEAAEAIALGRGEPHSLVQAALQRAFRKHGEAVARRPGVVLLGSLALVAFCLLGTWRGGRCLGEGGLCLVALCACTMYHSSAAYLSYPHMVWGEGAVSRREVGGGALARWRLAAVPRVIAVPLTVIAAAPRNATPTKRLLAHSSSGDVFVSPRDHARRSAGLIRFRVETDPQRLWVGPGSQAARDKAAFDASFGPFYRVEQLILSTTPAANGTFKSADSGLPAIVNDAHLRLLFAMQAEVDALTGKLRYCRWFAAA